jgi:hypothetical protein
VRQGPQLKVQGEMLANGNYWKAGTTSGQSVRGVMPRASCREQAQHPMRQQYCALGSFVVELSGHCLPSSEPSFLGESRQGVVVGVLDQLKPWQCAAVMLAWMPGGTVRYALMRRRCPGDGRGDAHPCNAR